MYENSAQGALSLIGDNWLLILILFVGYLVVAGLGTKVLGAFGEKALGMLKGLAAGFVPSATPTKADEAAEAALKAARSLVDQAGRTGDANMLRSAVDVLLALQKASAVLLLLAFVGCGTGDSAESAPGPCGWIKPPTNEELMSRGAEPPRTLGDAYPHLLDSQAAN